MLFSKFEVLLLLTFFSIFSIRLLFGGDHGCKLCLNLLGVLCTVRLSQELDSSLLRQDAFEQSHASQGPVNDICHLVGLLDGQESILLLARRRVHVTQPFDNLERLDLSLEQFGA